jgi:ubiquinone/menaquinone biosynthesis C-methylase UbiE
LIHEILASGRRNTAAEWEAYLERFHEMQPNANEFFTLLKTPDGRTSYTVAAEAVAALNPRSVLELACGEGNLADALFERLDSKAQYTGIDVSGAELDIARRRFALERRATFVRCDARTLPFTGDAFSVVVSHQFCNFLPEPLPVLAEAARVLAPGGTFVSAMNRGWIGHSEDVNWMKLHRAAVEGLRNTCSELYWPPLMYDERMYDDQGIREVFSSVIALDDATLSFETFTVSRAMSPQMLVAMYSRLYVFGTVPDRRIVEQAVSRKAAELADADGLVPIEIPFRLVRIRKRG